MLVTSSLTTSPISCLVLFFFLSQLFFLNWFSAALHICVPPAWLAWNTAHPETKKKKWVNNVSVPPNQANNRTSLVSTRNGMLPCVCITYTSTAAAVTSHWAAICLSHVFFSLMLHLRLTYNALVYFLMVCPFFSFFFNILQLCVAKWTSVCACWCCLHKSGLLRSEGIESSAAYNYRGRLNVRAESLLGNCHKEHQRKYGSFTSSTYFGMVQLIPDIE